MLDADPPGADAAGHQTQGLLSHSDDSPFLAELAVSLGFSGLCSDSSTSDLFNALGPLTSDSSTSATCSAAAGPSTAFQPLSELSDFANRSLYPIISAKEMLERRPAGAMGDGAVFVQTVRGGAIMPVEGERCKCSKAEAEEWETGAEGRYKTANYVCGDDYLDLCVIVCDDDDGTGKYCYLKDVWSRCAQELCRIEGETHPPKPLPCPTPPLTAAGHVCRQRMSVPPPSATRS